MVKLRFLKHSIRGRRARGNARRQASSPRGRRVPPKERLAWRPFGDPNQEEDRSHGYRQEGDQLGGTSEHQINRSQGDADGVEPEHDPPCTHPAVQEAVVKPRPLEGRRTKTQAMSRMGTARINRAVPILAGPRIARAPKVKPANWAPQSPMNMRAGAQLKTRKPIRAAARIRGGRTNTSLPVRVVAPCPCTRPLQMARRMAAIVTTPPARPSRPSRKLTVFIMATSQKRVKAPATGRGRRICKCFSGWA